MIRKFYTLLLDQSLVDSISLQHETDSVEAYIERLLIQDQQKQEEQQQQQEERNIFYKLLTYTRNSLGYPDGI